MADKTEIAWCDSTFNPWIGCTKVGPGCDNCYAEADFCQRKKRAVWGTGQPRVRTSEQNWKKPLRWNATPFYECHDCGWRGDKPETAGGSFTNGLPSCPQCDSVWLVDARRRVFCASLADVFDNEVPVEWRRDLFALIRATPNLDWLLLTKRIGNAGKMIAKAVSALSADDRNGSGWPNVWIGATICNQAEADRDIPKLLAVPAAVRFVSMEPLLGPVDLSRWIEQIDHCGSCGAEHEPGQIIFNDSGADVCPSCGAENVTISTWGQEQAERYRTGERYNDDSAAGRSDISGTSPTIDWVVTGGESGPRARPMHPAWARSLRDQCEASGVPFLFKQWGEHAPNWLNDDAGNKIPGSEWIGRMGKNLAGRLLDGKLHNEFPGARQ